MNDDRNDSREKTPEETLAAFKKTIAEALAKTGTAGRRKNGRNQRSN